MRAKKLLCILMSAAIIVMMAASFGAPAAASSADTTKMAGNMAGSLQEDILFAMDNDTYNYTGYRGAALSSWAVKYVNMAVLLGLLPDEVSDYFAEPITRQDFAILAARFVCNATGNGYDELIEYFGTKTFPDCSETAVGICAAMGIITGYEDNTFKPYNYITRQEAAAMLSRIAMLTGCYANNYNGEYNDAGGLWGEKYISNASKLKDPFMGAAVMNGMGNGEFSPSSYYSREQAVVTIVRLLGATVACHTGYDNTQPSPFGLPKGSYYRTDSTSALQISYFDKDVYYSLTTSKIGDLEGTSSSGYIYYDIYTGKLKGSDSEIFFTLNSDFSITVETDWLDEAYYVYNMFDGVYNRKGSSDVPPTPTPTPSPSDEDNDSGKKLTVDTGNTLDIGEAVMSDPINFVKTYFGPVVNPVNPDKTEEILQAIKDGTKKLDVSLESNGSMTVSYYYWGTRSQLENYVIAMLNEANSTVTDAKVAAMADFYAKGGMVGTTVGATCGGVMLGSGNISFSNEKSQMVTVPNAGVQIYLSNVRDSFKLFTTLDVSNIQGKKGPYMMIDPENHLIVCYEHFDDTENTTWIEGCWILFADVNSDGKLVLNGVFGQNSSTGMREFAKVNYTVEVSAKS